MRQLAVDKFRMEKLCLAENSLRLQKCHVKEITGPNEMLLFMSGPEGVHSALAKNIFVITREISWKGLGEELERPANSALSNLKMLAVVVEAQMEQEPA